uniref:ENTH domain-containing protein n=2 Tax=Macrostomum lignano TaxID=282301 RepID=A0A1I8IFE2_9PLAT
MTTLRRNLKNVVHNYSDAQVKVRKATSNDPWGPSGALMSEISDMTYNSQAFSEIMSMLWKRLADKAKHWRHICKGLVLMEYLVKTGSEKVAWQCRENVSTLRLLTSFEYPSEERDPAQSIRDKATKLIALLEDPDRLKSERASAIKAKNRMRGDSRDIPYSPPRQSQQPPQAESKQPLPAAPDDAIDADLELEIALQVSREEYNLRQEEQQREELRLQSVLEASRLEEETLAPLRMPPPLNSTGVRRERGENSNTKQQQQDVDYLSQIDVSLSAAPANAPDPWSASAFEGIGSASNVGATSRPDCDTAELPPEPPDLCADSFEPWNSSPFGAQIGTSSNNPFIASPQPAPPQLSNHNPFL